MKRHGQLFGSTFTRDALHQAFLDARKSKRAKRACFQFERRLGANLDALHHELHDRTYAPSPYYSFEVREPKPRRIYAPAFRDCVVQHAIYRVLYPIFDSTFIAESFACRYGKGTHAASDHVQRAMRRCPGDRYILKLDVRKFFYSIDRPMLRRLIERKIKDRRLVDVTMQFADHDEPAGIPLGNLLSQLFALIYLNPVDHLIKREIKIEHYARYVDDMILIGLTRDECLAHRGRIERFLADELGLALSKSSISQVRRGVNFVGYRTWRGRRFIRKHSLYKFRRAVAAGKHDSVVSLLGHARRTDSLRWMMDYLGATAPVLYRALPAGYRGALCS